MNNFIKLRKLGAYSIALLSITVQEFRFCSEYLESVFKTHLSKEEYLHNKTLLKSVVFNCGLMNPMFWEYKKMIGKNFHDSANTSTLVSTLMLLEDILLDEVSETKQNIDAVFSQTNLQNPHPLTRLSSKLFEQILNSFEDPAERLIQHNLINSLHIAQTLGEEVSFETDKEKLMENIIEKGNWFPTLVFAYNPRMNIKEIEALKYLGAWIKTIDDMVDIKKDLANNKVSLFTHPKTSEEALKIVEDLRNQAFKKIKELPYEDTLKNDFLYRISVQTISYKKYCEKLNHELAFLKPACDKSLTAALLVMVYSSLFAIRQILKFG